MSAEPAVGRAKGRELALSVLCHLDSYPAAERAEALELLWNDPPRGDDDGEDAFAALCGDPQARGAATTMLERCLPLLAELDGLIERTSARWRLERMDRVDLNIIRLAAAEFAAADTPRGVVLSEAVRLAARYGSERSPRFVNGLVEDLAQLMRGDGG